jgi:hypothetical protein
MFDRAKYDVQYHTDQWPFRRKIFNLILRYEILFRDFDKIDEGESDRIAVNIAHKQVEAERAENWLPELSEHTARLCSKSKV